jgi:hypothetical protein
MSSLVIQIVLPPGVDVRILEGRGLDCEQDLEALLSGEPDTAPHPLWLLERNLEKLLAQLEPFDNPLPKKGMQTVLVDGFFQELDFGRLDQLEDLHFLSLGYERPEQEDTRLWKENSRQQDKGYVHTMKTGVRKIPMKAPVRVRAPKGMIAIIRKEGRNNRALSKPRKRNGSR